MLAHVKGNISSGIASRSHVAGSTGLIKNIYKLTLVLQNYGVQLGRSSNFLMIFKFQHRTMEFNL